MAQENLYYSNLTDASKNWPSNICMRPNWLNMMIVRVESAKKLLESGGDVHPKAREALEQYEVLEETTRDGVNEKKLFYKRAPGVLWEVVPLDKTYPVVLKAHTLTYHGNIETMEKWLAIENYCLAPFCLPVLISVCTQCQAIKKVDNPIQSPEKTVKIKCEPLVEPAERVATEATTLTESLSRDFEKQVQISVGKPQTKSQTMIINCGQVTTINMDPVISDKSKLNDLLIYEDKDTGFLVMRPVSSSDFVDSVSSELIHIFTDIPPPSTLIVQKSLYPLYLEIVERINKVFQTDLKLVSQDVVAKQVVEKVNTALKSWVEQGDLEGKWYLGCYLVQWTLNNTRSDKGLSAYEKMFRRSYNEVTISE